MNRKFGIQNFRVFDDKGAQFKLAPITVLTGCNSSGKSSLIKAMMLFESFFKKIEKDYLNSDLGDLSSYPLVLNEGEHKLARFEKTLNKGSKNDEMIFSFARHSLFADSEIEIEFVFKGNENNLLGDGLLDKLRIKHGNAYIYVYSFNPPEDEKNMFIDHQAFIDMYFNFLQKVSDKKSTDSDTFSINFTPHLNQSMNEMFKTNILFKNLSNVGGKSNSVRDNQAFIFLMKSSDKKIEKLVSFFKSLKNRRLTNTILFDSPAYTYLKNATKENINELIFAKIEEYNSDQYLKKSVTMHIKHIVDSFEKSDHIYFKDYFSELQYEYLSDKYINKLDPNDNNWVTEFKNRNKTVNLDFIADTKNFLKLYTIGLMETFTDFNLDNLPENEPFANFEQFCVIMHGFSDFVEAGYYSDNANLNFYEEEYFDGESMCCIYQQFLAVNDHEKWLDYINLFLEDAFFNLPDFVDNVEFINSNRAKVERFYDLSNQNEGFGLLIKEYVSKNNRSILLKDKKEYKLGDFLRKWVNNLEIADDVVFELTKEGSGVFIYLVNDNEQTLLADLGYGITQVLSMLLKIELSILTNFEPYKNFSTTLSSSTVLGADAFFNANVYNNKEQTITIEEPEANLHPKLQSRLADMFMEANELYNINFILETHSEYLIRKLQYLVANPEHNAKSEDISIYYMYHPDKIPEGQTQVVDLEIRPDGLLKKDFGEGFFDEASSWTFELLKLQNLN